MIIKGGVIRQKSTPLGTPGRLVLDNGFSCDTLELPWHNNERGKSCTAPGIDHGRVWFSPTFKRLVIRYADRNGRKDVLLHNANFAAEERDIDGDGDLEVTQLHGCTAPGYGYTEIADKTNDLQWGIKSSVKALEALLTSLLDGSPVVVGPEGFASGYHSVAIEYSWAAGCAPEEA